jgi:methyl-accepting chemotaxis protein
VLTHSANAKANNGSQIAANAMSAMLQITESSQQIATITAVIDSIAFQTNLLALNASVEAARAGQEGRGFSVVAQEVRNLAQRSAEAAKQIKELISDSNLKVQEGTELVSESGTALQEIISAIGQVDNLVSEITMANKEQRNGIEQTNAAVTQIDHATQENATLAAETVQSCDALKVQTEKVKQLMRFFQG